MVAEWLALAACALGLALAAFVAGFDAALFLLAPLAVLCAVRCGAQGAALLVACVMPLALVPTIAGNGPLAHMPRPMEALSALLIAMLLAGLVAALALRRVRHQAEARAGFMAAISHDIRTPMNGVLGFADLLAQGELTPEQRRSVDRIAESGQTMVRLLNDVLDLSQIDAGRLRLEEAEVDLHAELRWAVALFAPRAAEKGLQLTCEIDRFVPHMVMADGLRLRQVLINLVGNAVKFTDQGFVTLSAHARRGARQSEVVIAVADSGIGIAADRLPHVFKPYDQGGRAGHGARGGAGLGLAIAAQLTALMDGQITAASTPGKGSTFTLTLPLRVVAGEAEPATGAGGALPATSRSAVA